MQICHSHCKDTSPDEAANAKSRALIEAASAACCDYQPVQASPAAAQCLPTLGVLQLQATQSICPDTVLPEPQVYDSCSLALSGCVGAAPMRGMPKTCGVEGLCWADAVEALLPYEVSRSEDRLDPRECKD